MQALRAINIKPMDLSKIESILSDFSTLPKEVLQPTYLDLCQYPTRRFEEICSRLLAFYFQPLNEHKLNDLVLKSLIECLNSQKQFNYLANRFTVIEEENAEGKRIDLVLIGDNFIIGIENKIFANLYNPLEIYMERLIKYKKELTIGVVLSLRKISKESEKELLLKSGFHNITYSTLINQLKINIGNYLIQCDNKYLIFFNDFISTIENMEQNNILNSGLTSFFYENSDKLDELFELYDEFNKRIKSIQFQNIQSMKEEIIKQTNHNWRIWEDWDLGCDFIVNNHKLGIESYFEKSKSNPLGKFFITITTWNLTDWHYFKDTLISQFPDKNFQINNNRAELSYETLFDQETDVISGVLIELFNKIKNINWP